MHFPRWLLREPAENLNAKKKIENDLKKILKVHNVIVQLLIYAHKKKTND